MPLTTGPVAAHHFAEPDAALAQSTRVTPTFDSALSWTDNAGTDRDGAADWLLAFAPNAGEPGQAIATTPEAARQAA